MYCASILKSDYSCIHACEHTGGSVSYRDAAAALADTQLHSAVQEHVAGLSRELEAVEREVGRCSQPVALHRHGRVSWVGATARKQESRHDEELVASERPIGIHHNEHL